MLKNPSQKNKTTISAHSCSLHCWITLKVKQNCILIWGNPHMQLSMNIVIKIHIFQYISDKINLDLFWFVLKWNSLPWRIDWSLICHSLEKAFNGTESRLICREKQKVNPGDGDGLRGLAVTCPTVCVYGRAPVTPQPIVLVLGSKLYYILHHRQHISDGVPLLLFDGVTLCTIDEQIQQILEENLNLSDLSDKSVDSVVENNEGLKG